MYSLKETFALLSDQPPYEGWDGRMVAMEFNANHIQRANLTRGFTSCYAFLLVKEGRVKMRYYDRELTVEQQELMIYSPGTSIDILEVSEDFRGLWLAVDERVTLEMGAVRNAVRMVHAPLAQLAQPCWVLSDEEAAHVEELLRLFLRYFHTQGAHQEESLRMIYNLFLLELSQLQVKEISTKEVSKRQEEIFWAFHQLLPEHFLKHHDIAFYADQLAITPTYLSRVVREMSGGRTVMDYINEMLLMEATFLLHQSSMTLSQISDHLHFAEPTTFTRFFTRLKGVSPKEYRKGRA